MIPKDERTPFPQSRKLSKPDGTIAYKSGKKLVVKEKVYLTIKTNQ